jgi:hypothetical protein
MKKTMSKTAQRKLALRSESIMVLRSSQLTVAGAGFVPVPPQHPNSPFSGCSEPPFN